MEQRATEAIVEALRAGPTTAEALARQLAGTDPGVAVRGPRWLETRLAGIPGVERVGEQYHLRADPADDEVVAPGKAQIPLLELDRAISSRYLLLDLETNADRAAVSEHEIIELAAIRIENQAVIDTFHHLIRNERPLAQVTMEITGLVEEDLQNAHSLREVLSDFVAWAGRDPVIAHNGFGYDFLVLDAACLRLDLPVLPGVRLDSLDLAHLAFPRAGDGILPDVDGTLVPLGRSLEQLAEFLDLGSDQEHRALEDVRLLTKILRALIAAMRQDHPADQLVTWLLQQAGHPWAAFLPPVKERPRLDTVLPPPEPAAPMPASGRFDVLDAVAPLEPGGALLVDGRRHRPGQVQMAETVAKAFAEGRRQLIEAPTGIGKTLGYLVPSVAYARACGQPVVIAVHSKVLQNQVLTAIPELAAAFGPVRWVMVKGLENYCSVEALDGMLDSPPDDHDEAMALAILCAWAARTPTGDWDDLRVWAIEQRLPFSSLRHRLQLDEEPGPVMDELGERCFYRRSSEALADADIAVLNHAVLVRRSDWRDWSEHLVLDEAHNLEDAATAAMSERVSGSDLERLLREVHDPTRRWGMLGRWLDATGISARSEAPQRVLQIRRHAAGLLQAFGSTLIEFVRDRSGARRKEVEQFGTAYRIQPSDTGRGLYRGVRASASLLVAQLRELAEAIDQLEVPEQPRGRYRRRRLERENTRMGRQIRESARLVFQIVCDPGADETVAIVDLTVDDDGYHWGLRRVPLTVGPQLGELWEELEAAILTSATLRVRGDFGHLIGRLGLGDAKCMPIDTPFSALRENELVVLTDHLPTPSASLMASFAVAETDEIARLLTLARGRALALFTSRARMVHAATHVRPLVELHGIPLLCQGDAPAPALVERIRGEAVTSLLATRSFWEGVDIPGEALSLLVVEKLPFDSPGDPIVAARLDFLERQGRDPFADYLVPQAALRFAQGVGRLIRSETDRGAVAVLDKRLRRPLPYREHFLSVLPGPPTFLRPLSADEGYAGIASHLGLPWDDSVRALLDSLGTADVWSDLGELQLDDEQVLDDDLVKQRLEEVRKRLGFADWRPGQFEVMRRFIRGDDVLAILPTGSGKSLTYQLPALLRPGLTLVVSPLVALMRDQVRSLHEHEILAAAAVHTGQSQAEQEEVLAGARSGRYRLLYVSPERLWSRRFRIALRDVPLERVAVDEAHCISQWGHSFRPEYAAIADAIQDITSDRGRRPAIAALTATATTEVQKDVRRLLDLRAGTAVAGSPDRPELQYHVVDCEDRDDRDLQVVRIVEAFRGQPVIVYVPRRADTIRLAGLLRAANHNARAYHGGMEAPERIHTEEAFVDDDLQVIVATKAFGLGIDKPDIAAVVHLEMPASVEEYIQETGRAARGASQGVGPASGVCVLLRTPRDCAIHRLVQQSAAPDPALVRSVWGRLHGGRFTGPIASLLPKEDEEAVALAASYLIRAGAVVRGDDVAWRGRVWLPSDVDELLNDLAGSNAKLATQGLQVVEVARVLDTEEYRAEDWARRFGHPIGEVEAVLLELHRRGMVGFWNWETAWQLEPVMSPDWNAIEAALEERKAAVRHMAAMARNYRSQDELCRRRWFLEYLSVDYAGHCGGCDVCRTDLPRQWEEVDLTLEALMASVPAVHTVLALVQDIGDYGYSRRTLEMVLTGSQLKYQPHLGEHHLHGILRAFGEREVTRLMDDLLQQGLLRELSTERNGNSYTQLRLTDSGRARL